ncbi:MAG TPA: heme biosynthesis HemY N-terminal domain-containing protein [Caulobacteraceae bacterium]|jgi:HemY protein
MIRAALIVLAVVALAVVIIALRGEPGAAELTWFHWNIRTTAAAATMLLIFFTLAASLFWRGLIWLAEAPRRAARSRAESRRRQGSDALTRGFLAAAGGDGAEARRQAQRASTLVDDTPSLVRLLSAQAAEAAGDAEGARAAYAAMLGFPELRMAAHRGLMQAALAEGDVREAQTHAEAAYGLARTAPWAWRAVLEAKLAIGDWTAALEMMQGALERKIVSPIVAERARAALLTARAADPVAEEDDKVRQAALDDCQAAMRLRPDFIPASVIAARLFAAEGRAARAAQVIEAAWKVSPHPALWLAYRDLRTDETPRERAARLATLAGFNADARESRILTAEQALIAGDAVGARAAAKALEDEPLTRRLAGLRARIATAIGDRDEARVWTARGAEAPQEPDWSDLDPEGRAFAYTPHDWARIAQVYAERGELTHPRLERRERGMSDLAELPPAYADSAAFISAAEAGAAAAPIVDDSDFGAELDSTNADPDPPPAGQRRVFGGGRGKRS